MKWEKNIKSRAAYGEWTINLKSFEIQKVWKNEKDGYLMNYKLEKFWNGYSGPRTFQIIPMNYKLEKFWNIGPEYSLTEKDLMNYKLEKFWNRRKNERYKKDGKWTINLKSFEIQTIFDNPIYQVLYEL